jgi:uncharacterized protein (TIGR03435 family)
MKRFTLLSCALVAALTVFAVAGPLRAQTPGFDVATIRPSGPNTGSSSLGFNRNNHFATKNVTLSTIIKDAWRLNGGSDDQLVGGPGWVRTAEWDIDAKEDEATAAKLATFPMMERVPFVQQMVQGLLVERFHLKVHTEKRELPVDAVTIAPGGVKLENFVDGPRKDGGENWQGLHIHGRGQMEARGATLDMLLGALASQPEVGNRVTVNQTGLTGRYNFKLDWTPEDGRGPRDDAADAPTLFTAMQQQLGLKVKATKAPVEVLVIDSVEKPSEN